MKTTLGTWQATGTTASMQASSSSYSGGGFAPQYYYSSGGNNNSNYGTSKSNQYPLEPPLTSSYFTNPATIVAASSDHSGNVMNEQKSTSTNYLSTEKAWY